MSARVRQLSEPVERQNNKICITSGDILHTPVRAFILPFSKQGTIDLGLGWPGRAFQNWVVSRFRGGSLQESLRQASETKWKNETIGDMKTSITVINKGNETVYGVWEEVIFDPSVWKGLGVSNPPTVNRPNIVAP